MWQQWANLVLGLWVIAIAFLGLSAYALMWTLVVTGIIIAGLALWGGAIVSNSDVTYRKTT